VLAYSTVRQTSYVAKDGVTASGYGAEYTREIRAATVLLVMKSFHLMPRMRLWHVMWNASSLRESSSYRAAKNCCYQT